MYVQQDILEEKEEEEEKKDMTNFEFVMRRGRNNRNYLNVFNIVELGKRKAEDEIRSTLGRPRTSRIDFDESIIWNKRIMKRLSKEHLVTKK